MKFSYSLLASTYTSKTGSKSSGGETKGTLSLQILGNALLYILGHCSFFPFTDDSSLVLRAIHIANFAN